MSVSIEDTQTHQAATSYRCSRDADRDGEGGRNGYPSDPEQAALTKKKYYVAHSEDRDRMEEEASDSKAPRPIISRTRSRLVMKSKTSAVMLEDVDDKESVSDDDNEEADGAGAGATSPKPVIYTLEIWHTDAYGEFLHNAQLKM